MSSPCCGCLACTCADARPQLPHTVMVLTLLDLLHATALRLWCLSVGWRLLGLVWQEMVRAESICVSVHQQLGLMTHCQSAAQD